MVRLKVCSSIVSTIGYNLFQFHYGSIKRLGEKTISQVHYPFQFHYGSIKRALEMLSKSILIYFNSTMVRLKDSTLRNFGKQFIISIPLWFD